MGIEEEADRTLFVRNLDSRVTEELLFELFLQAGPLVRTKIPKDNDGKQKTFGFAVYKHEVSAPYAVQLLNGAMLFGRTLHVQFRSGSSHGNSPGKTQNSNPANTPNPHGARSPVQFNSPPYTPPQTQRSFFSPDNNLQKHAMMNNMMWYTQQMQHLEQLTPQSLSRPGGSSRHDNTPYRQNNESRGRYQDESGSGRHQNFGQNDRSRHHDNRSMKRHYDDRGSYQDSRLFIRDPLMGVCI
uniref:RRM domain-containing protein n=1 Tax=Knipowitschia caucasica TaxID=637954 RepID=A0AAV2J2M5_KNICA